MTSGGRRRAQALLVGSRGDCRTGHQHRRRRRLRHLGHLEARHQAHTTPLKLRSRCCCLPVVLISAETHSMCGIHQVACFELRGATSHDLWRFLAEECCLVDEGATLQSTACVATDSRVSVLPSIVTIHSSSYRLWRLSSFVRSLRLRFIISIRQVTILTPSDHRTEEHVLRCSSDLLVRLHVAKLSQSLSS